MLDLNDLRVFEKVATLRGFSAAARELAIPKSSVSRSISRLEEELGTRLMQRTTRAVVLTAPGEALLERCSELMRGVDAAVDQVASMAGEPRGRLKVGSGIGFGVNVLADLLPAFLDRYPAADIELDLKSEFSDLVAEGFDVAIRLGPMPDSSLVAVNIGSLRRLLCATPEYLSRHGTPSSPSDLSEHQVIEMPGVDGRPRTWIFNRGRDTERVEVRYRLSVNEVLTIHRLVLNGAGPGVLSAYLGEPAIADGHLIQLLPEWSLPTVDVSLVYASKRIVPPLVRAFVEFMRETSVTAHWNS